MFLPKYIVSAANGSTDSLESLSRDMAAFYDRSPEYPAFLKPHDQSRWLSSLAPIVGLILKAKGVARVLELGAGSSMFAEHFAKDRETIVYEVQDITDRNAAYLSKVADSVHIGDVSDIQNDNGYDLVFSMFTFEHVVNPVGFLEQVDRLLAPGGFHVVICPRYDFPGYMCPSLRQRTLLKRSILAVALVLHRFASRMCQTQRFLINSRPSALMGPWYRDADAVHLVSAIDVRLWHEKHGYAANDMVVASGGIKDWFFVRYLLLAGAFRKAVAA